MLVMCVGGGVGDDMKQQVVFEWRKSQQIWQAATQ